MTRGRLFAPERSLMSSKRKRDTMDLTDWNPQEEILQRICADDPCKIDQLWPAIHFTIHALIEPPDLPMGQRELFSQIRAERVRQFIIQVAAIAQMMNLNENEVASACFNVAGSAAKSLEERIFAGVYDAKKWRKRNE